MFRATAAFALSMSLAAGAWACSCMRSDRAEVIARSDAAFSARVLRTWREGDPNVGKMLARVRVTQSYKGVRRGRIITLTTGANSAMCGIEFVRGQTFSLAARKTGPGQYSAGLCDFLPAE